MPYQVDIEYDLNPKTDSVYTVSSHHRRARGNNDKSVWIISHDEEVELFIFSKDSGWIDGNKCYGLKLNGTIVQVVGRNPQNHNLKIAKFLDASRNNKWHGFPADPKNKRKDIPSTEILTNWRELNYIGKSQVRKLKQQIVCDL